MGFFKIIRAQQQKNAAEAIGRKLFMRHKAIVCLLSCDVFKKGRVVHANIHTEKKHTRGLGPVLGSREAASTCTSSTYCVQSLITTTMNSVCEDLGRNTDGRDIQRDSLVK